MHDEDGAWRCSFRLAIGEDLDVNASLILMRIMGA